MTEALKALPPDVNIEDIVRSVSRKREARVRNRRRLWWMVRILSLLVVLTAWQIYGNHSLAIIFVPFTAVVASGYDLLVNGPLAGALVYSIVTFLIGLVLGSVLGIAVGLAMGWFETVNAAIGHYIYALYATPMVAIVPLITLWFGFGVSAQLLIIVLFVFFPVVVTVYNGVKQVDSSLLEVGRSFRATQGQMWFHIVLPGSVPFIMTGITQGVAMGLVGMFISEIFTALSGIGQVLETQANAYHTGPTLATVLVIMILGVIFRTLVAMMQRRLSPWFKDN